MQLQSPPHLFNFRLMRVYVGLCLLTLFVRHNAIADEPAFVHPGIAHTRAGIQRIKSKLDSLEEPWTSEWNQLKQSPDASLDWSPDPRAHVERGPSNNPDIGSSEFDRDGTAAYTLALRWVLSGDEAYAQKSARIIDVWSATLKTVTNHDARLLIGMTGQKYCNAAEILRHTWDGWPESNQEQFRSMLRNVWYPIIKDFYPSANGNWDASMMQTMIAMGIYLDDREMFQRAVDYFLEGEGTGMAANRSRDDFRVGRQDGVREVRRSRSGRRSYSTLPWDALMFRDLSAATSEWR
ncbi:alginate lyase family protein [Neorhodopirellula pilleata]|uniref:Alginate lyase n=1 Tax=Neorhodopirellula pilleata TaxID=2714738 RepID=A0A5C5ZW19_9BACT|nr:alginate lyase family protein [Neorhodopirellula pilleata]TWT91217.1 Alginate lyase [Neorhodopirellula pilleata]